MKLEQPAKFGYSPGAGRFGGGGSGDDSGSAEMMSPTPGCDDWPPPPVTPGLSRYWTAPASTAPLQHGEARRCTMWPMKASADSSKTAGGGTKHAHPQGTHTDNRADSLGSAAEWDRTLEGAGGGGWGYHSGRARKPHLLLDFSCRVFSLALCGALLVWPRALPTSALRVPVVCIRQRQGACCRKSHGRTAAVVV